MLHACTRRRMSHEPGTHPRRLATDTDGQLAPRAQAACDPALRAKVARKGLCRHWQTCPRMHSATRAVRSLSLPECPMLYISAFTYVLRRATPLLALRPARVCSSRSSVEEHFEFILGARTRAGRGSEELRTGVAVQKGGLRDGDAKLESASQSHIRRLCMRRAGPCHRGSRNSMRPHLRAMGSILSMGSR